MMRFEKVAYLRCDMPGCNLGIKIDALPIHLDFIDPARVDGTGWIVIGHIAWCQEHTRDVAAAVDRWRTRRDR